MDMKKLKVAMLGFGGIARAHYAGYRLLERLGAPISLEAVFDCNPAQFERELKINIEPKPVKLDESVRRYTDLEELFANEEFDMADVCLPSYLHKSFSVRALREGKHVLCEKPMALSSEECAEMIAAARESGKRLMVAQCLRFDPEYLYLKKAVEEGTFGRLLRIEMNRLCAHPAWGYENWFADTEKSGGCILDMHIHDVDMARFLLGDPQAVSTVAYDGISRWAFESTRLFYPDVVPVINGSWSETKGTPFRGDFYAVFERATLSTRDGRLRVYPLDGEAYEPSPDGIDMYAAEIRYFADTILNDLPNTVNPPESAAESVKVIEALRRSAAQGGEKIAYP